MKWVEVIELRLFTRKRQLVEDELLILRDAIAKKDENHKIDLFSRCDLESDFSVHLTNESEEIAFEGSQLGNQIISVLRDFGQVNHKIWIELKKEVESRPK